MAIVPSKFVTALNVTTDAAPASPSNGDIYYSTTDSRFYGRENGVWKPMIFPQEYISVVSTTGAPYTATGDADVWYVPTLTFKIPLTAGTWDINCYWQYFVRPSAGSGAVQMALSPSTTPGAALINPVYGSNISTNVNNRQSAIYTLFNYTVASPTDLYVHMRCINIGGYATATTFQYGSNDIVNSIMTARRIKY